ncbi:hypothetical protein J6590_016894 [Homalodisca vitripennis]|nr:hypothetical protein J6590_016894 [Homalodisca vitripennis]
MDPIHVEEAGRAALPKSWREGPFFLDALQLTVVGFGRLAPGWRRGGRSRSVSPVAVDWVHCDVMFHSPLRLRSGGTLLNPPHNTSHISVLARRAARLAYLPHACAVLDAAPTRCLVTCALDLQARDNMLYLPTTT